MENLTSTQSATTNLPNGSSPIIKNDLLQKILAEVEKELEADEQNGVTTRELSEATNTSRDWARRRLNKMVKEGKLIKKRTLRGADLYVPKEN